MKILLTGATGFVGKELGKALALRGHSLNVITRDVQKAKSLLPFPAEYFECDLNKDDLPQESLQGVEAVIHLAGEPIAAKRWSSSQKKKILESRIFSTKKIAQVIAHQKPGQIKTVLYASAIGFYGSRGDERLTESSAAGSGFLSDVCQQWESAGVLLSLPQIRSVHVRIGIVLGHGGGMMEKVLPIFKLGAGGRLGDGKQWMSWIHIDDLVGIFVSSLENEKVSGPVNATAPKPVMNGDFTKILSKTIHRPALFPAPSMALKLALGEMSELMLGSQKVYPEKIQTEGFTFKFPSLESAVKNLYGDLGDEVFIEYQWVPKKVSEVFSFFSDAKNLQEITPPWLHFKIKGMTTDKIQKDTELNYQLKIRGLPVKWTTLITQWMPNKSFQDVQLKGPYAKWHHTHTFEPMGDGTLVTDRVEYKVPMGFWEV
ncbi:MAG: TIGR01777 family protein [Deltaproteobacteria bacterium]|nr:MAG: TIGR01777 family protein [Deltaproteobacteria bacterium]